MTCDRCGVMLPEGAASADFGYWSDHAEAAWCKWCEAAMDEADRPWRDARDAAIRQALTDDVG